MSSIDPVSLAKHLTDYYRAKGVDTTIMLDHPVFTKLNPIQQAEFLKSHGKYLFEGSQPGLTTQDKNQIKADVVANSMTAATVIGGLAGAAYRHAVPKASLAQAVLVAGLGGAISAGITGTATGILRSDEARQRRAAIRAQLAELATNPSDYNAVATLASGGMHAQVAPNAVRNAVLNKVLAGISDRNAATFRDEFAPSIFRDLTGTP